MDNYNVTQEITTHIIEELKKYGLDHEGQISYLPYQLSYETHKYLIQVNRLSPDILLKTALEIDNKLVISASEVDHKNKPQ